MNDQQTTPETALDAFATAYILCALWTFDENAPSGPFETSGRFQELFPKIDGESLSKMIADCAAFQKLADLEGYPIKNAGHDFWLTRNGHGCGFWENDFGTEDQCARLTALSKTFRECDLYYGDDGKIYI